VIDPTESNNAEPTDLITDIVLTLVKALSCLVLLVVGAAWLLVAAYAIITIPFTYLNNLLK
jgi:hypothetical protein